jgi:molybdate transport system ATP-binding protein
VRDGGQEKGATVRIRILARDVSLALSPATDTSLLNSLPVVVEQLADEGHPALALCRLRVGTSSSLLSRLTRRSAAALDLQPGQAMWAQIKAVALIG